MLSNAAATYYHGTTADRVPSIIERGLLPRHPLGPRSNFRGSYDAWMLGNQPTGIYAVSEWDEAEYWAQASQRARSRDAGTWPEPVIIEFRTSPRRRVMDDPETAGVVFPSRIPPTAIVNVHHV